MQLENNVEEMKDGNDYCEQEIWNSAPQKLPVIDIRASTLQYTIGFSTLNKITHFWKGHHS